MILDCAWRSLLERLACPRCRAPLREEDGGLICQGCERPYPVRDGIPLMLLDPPPAPPPPALDLTVLILAYNEANNLRRLFPVLLPVLADLGCRHEILVVDGGSRDDTVAVAESSGARVYQQRARGYANAFREGIVECRGRFTVTMDADLSHDPGTLRVLWRERETADLVVGSRYMQGSRADMTPFRRGLSHFMNGVFRAVLRVPVRDLSSGYRLYRTAMLRSLPLEGRDFEILVEALVRTWLSGWDVRELPIYYKPRGAGASNLRVVSFGMSYGRALRRLSRIRYGDDWREALREARRADGMLRAGDFESKQASLLVLGSAPARFLQAVPSAVFCHEDVAALIKVRRQNPLLVVAHQDRLPFADGAFRSVVNWGADSPEVARVSARPTA
ncbi:MAG: glycosyltransferase [Armatimonadetes bacterium]|nr:glycosyltransferase [Armatimonadota bacterium]